MKRLLSVLLITLCIWLVNGCIVGVDESGNYTLRPDPYTIDRGLDYLIRHEDSAKGESVEYYDSETGELIAPKDYPLYDIES